MRHDLQARFPEYANKVKFYIGDVRNEKSIADAMSDINCISHLAALNHVPLTKWFLATYFVSQDKGGISAVQLQAMLGVTYKTAWYVLARIRKAMGQRDETHQLSGIVEFDDAFLAVQQ